jgi:glutathione S-transferase
LFESGAILLHLANKYGKLDSDQLSKAAQWTMFANSTMCEALFYERNRWAASGGQEGRRGPDWDRH